MSGKMGNPAPIGLMAFALTIFMLGALNADLVDSHFKELITTFGFWWAGLGQVAVGLFELLHGNSFGALVFWTYGSLWLALSTVWYYSRQNEYNQFDVEDSHLEDEAAFGFVGAHHYKVGESLMLILFAIATLFFFIVSLRKNRALQVCLFLLFWTCIFLAIGEHVEEFKKIGGWGCMLTGCSAFYILVAEIVNEEWGYAVIPGIAPVMKAKSAEEFSIASVFQYNSESNSVFLNLTGCNFVSPAAVDKFAKELDEKFSAIGRQVHVVVNYKGVEIAPAIQDKYTTAIRTLQSKYYLSVKRFSATAFRDADSFGDVGGYGASKGSSDVSGALTVL